MEVIAIQLVQAGEFLVPLILLESEKSFCNELYNYSKCQQDSENKINLGTVWGQFFLVVKESDH